MQKKAQGWGKTFSYLDLPKGANKKPWRMVNSHPVTQPLAPKLEGAGMQTSANMMGQNDEYPPVN